MIASSVVSGRAPTGRTYVDAPLVDKHDFERRAACGSGTVVCPASRCSPCRPRARMVFVRSDTYRFRELQGSSSGSWFFRPRLTDRLPLLRSLSCPHPVGAIRDSCPEAPCCCLPFPVPALSSDRAEHLRRAVALPLHHQRPDDTRHLVRKCYRDQLGRLLRQHPAKSRVRDVLASAGVANHRRRPQNQQLSQVALPHLGDPSVADRCRPPVETSRGVRPIHTAKSRPGPKLSIAGARACTAIAPTSPTSGIVISRRNSSSSLTIDCFCLSTSSSCAFSHRSGQTASQPWTRPAPGAFRRTPRTPHTVARHWSQHAARPDRTPRGVERTDPDAVIRKSANRATKRRRSAASTQWGIQSSGMAAMTKRREW